MFYVILLLVVVFPIKSGRKIIICRVLWINYIIRIPNKGNAEISTAMKLPVCFLMSIEIDLILYR